MTNRQIIESKSDYDLACDRIKLHSEEIGDEYCLDDYYYGDFEGEVHVKDFNIDYHSAWKEAVRKEIQWLQEEAKT